MSKNARTNWNAAQRASERTTKKRKLFGPVVGALFLPGWDSEACRECGYQVCCCVELEVEVGEEPEEGVEFGIEIGNDEPELPKELNCDQAVLAMERGKYVHRLGGDFGTK